MTQKVLLYLFAPLLGLVSLTRSAEARTYLLACNTSIKSPPLGVTPLASLREASAATFGPGDELLVARGSMCTGTLLLQGSGTEAQPVLVHAFGEGALPKIRAEREATQAVELRNGSHWQLAELDIEGGTRRGLFVTATKGTAEDVLLRDLHVHDVYGPLLRKEDGLVVVAPSPGASLHHIVLDGVRAERTTLWSGIFVSGDEGRLRTNDVVVQNSIVHDVQGDGIVLFSLDDGALMNDTAWHTGMQHSYSIGTPNGIWTWHCRRCTVERSEAFLTDSPGVDGGSFDIDFGNSDNRVVHNFGHDTQGYCVSIFGAYGPTLNSEVAHNTCIRNGLSPRLAERQGAILLMTWSKGQIDHASLHDNVVLWEPSGNTPALQVGESLQASSVQLRGNALITRSDPSVAFEGQRFITTPDSTSSHKAADNAVSLEAWKQLARTHDSLQRPVQLSLFIGSDVGGEAARFMLQRVLTLAGQFSPEQLNVVVKVPACASRVPTLVTDWVAEASHAVQVKGEPCSARQTTRWRIASVRNSVSLPQETEREEVWRSIAVMVGMPKFGALPFVPVRAHD